MTPNSVYSANGRIESIFIFDTKEFALNPERAHPFQPVLRKYKQMADGLNKFHPVRMYIFFRITRKSVQLEPKPTAWLDEQENIYFIPVNLEEAVSIPTQWIQDVVSIPLEGELRFAEGLNPLLRKIVMNYAGTHVAEILSTQCPEGNLVHGKSGEYKYIIKATHKRGTCTEWAVRRMTSVNPLNTFSIPDSKNKLMNDHVLFHSDVYCTIGGSLGGNKELVLLSEPFEEDWADFTDTIKSVEAKLRKVSGKFGAPEFVIGHLPLIMINDEDSNIKHALSYNNCLVENYVDEDGIRRLHFYFPDFREVPEVVPVSKDAHQKLKKLSKLKVQHLLPVNALLSPELKAADGNLWEETQVGLPMLQTVEDKIKTVLHDLLHTIPNLMWDVSFISFDFLSSSRTRGALHCMTKVIHRSRT